MLNLQQQLKHQLKLSPQKIQYIKLLQLSNLALEQRVQAELAENPVLEEVVVLEEASQDDAGTEDDFDWELPAGDDDSYGYKARVDQEDRVPRPVVAEVSLAEHLRSQHALLSPSSLDLLIGEQIIGSIDEDGYLRRELFSIVDDIMFTYGKSLTEDDVERVLRQLQRLDPIGIGARSLQECLLVQVEALPGSMPGRDTAQRVLSECFEDFTMKRFGRIRQKLDVDERALKVAFDVVQRLNPKPGEGTITAQENYITPDFVVHATNDGFEISLDDRPGPRIGISREYRALFDQLTASNSKDGAGAEARQFLQHKFKSARWFIDAINQRRKTLLLVMHAIVTKQHDFFTLGPGHLRPLILADIADAVGMDISTISRVVGGKYVHCDFGVYELKYFFSEGVATHSGDKVSSREVKAIIDDVIRQEDKSRPLSDRALAEILDARGFQIARRTISKYRKQLGIPVARMRREIVLP